MSHVPLFMVAKFELCLAAKPWLFLTTLLNTFYISFNKYLNSRFENQYLSLIVSCSLYFQGVIHL